MADDQTQPQNRPAQPGARPQGAPQGGPPPANGNGQRKRARGPLFLILAAVVVLAGLAYFLYWLLVASHYVKTDDAYTGAEIAQITPQVSGAIEEVRVRETQAVRKGDVLVTIDPADARLAAAQAEAQYGQAIRQIRQALGSTEAASATIGARDADIARARTQLASAESDLAKARVDLQRRQALSGTGAVSGEELTNARNAFQQAEINVRAAQAAMAQATANRRAAQGQLAAQQAITTGGIESNPAVLAAKSALDTARLNLERTVIRAPIDGVIAKKQVEIGQRVQVGAPLMAVVPVQQVYVDANFKEVQLRKVRVGMPAEVESDLYGGSVKYHGQVVGFSGGSGSAFAVIPAQNATGNWIKVVQRVPVRIALDARELQQHPLRVGLSMKVKIDVTGPASRSQAPSARP